MIAKVTAAENLRPDFMRVLEPFHVRVLEAAADSVVIEATGAEDMIDSLIEAVKAFGILEMTRTGRVAMTTGNAPGFTIGGQAQSTEESIPIWNSTRSTGLPRNCS